MLFKIQNNFPETSEIKSINSPNNSLSNDINKIVQIKLLWKTGKITFI